VLGTLIFVATEVMLFSGFVSAFTIMRGSALIWPPPGQPRLPIAETAFNTLLLLASGAVLTWRTAASGARRRARARRSSSRSCWAPASWCCRAASG
jgi:heme/copper-type cytochrome/quinol oxidase subunit 3